MMIDMIFIFVSEIFDGGQHRVGSCLTETAQRTIFDLVAEFFKQFDVAILAFPLGNPVENFQHPGGARLDSRYICHRILCR